MKSQFFLLAVLMIGFRTSVAGPLPAPPADPPVSVTATAGTTGPTNYLTLKAAFDKINDGTHQGEITVKIIASTTETATAGLNASAPPSNYTSVVIYPEIDGLSITGNVAGPLILLNGADHVTIDGRVNRTGTTRSLTIRNTGASAQSAIDFTSGACQNALRYCKLEGNYVSETKGGVIGMYCTSGGGNNYDTIEYNSLTKSGTERLRNAIWSSGSPGHTSTGNLFRGNLIYDAIGGNHINYEDVYACGIHVNEYNDSVTISGNSFFETASFSLGFTTSYRGIAVHFPSGGTEFAIHGNYFGGTEAECGGTNMTKTGSSYDVSAIYVNTGTSCNVDIQQNTIRNITWNVGLNHYFRGIDFRGAGNASIGTEAGNVLGAASGNDAIVFTASGNIYGRSGFIGISIDNSGIVHCSNNLIGAITVPATPVATSGTNLTGIRKTGNGAAYITDNTIGSTEPGTTASLRALNPTQGEQGVIGIFCYDISNAPLFITGNTISGLSSLAVSTNSVIVQRVAGIQVNGGITTIRSNYIRDITNASKYAVAGSCSTTGIAILYDSGDKGKPVVSKNIIHSVTNSASGFSGIVSGIFSQKTGKESTISDNFIYGISVASTSGTVNGITVRGGGILCNNIISLGSGLSSGFGMAGIYSFTDSFIGYLDVWFNTIDIEGTVTGSSSHTYALRANASVYDIRNNILRNNRSGGTSGKHYAVSLPNANSLTIDFNDYSTAGGFLSVINSADKTTLTAWRSATGGDQGSYNADPQFPNPGGTAVTDYLPVPGNFVAGLGTGIFTDHRDTVRSLIYPSIGALEYPVSVSGQPVEITATSGNTGPLFYNTLKEAFDAINAGVHTGNITLKLHYSTLENATALLNPGDEGTASWSSVRLYPVKGGLAIAGSIAGPLIDLNGADHVTIDGRVNGSGSVASLSIINASTSPVEGTSAIRLIRDACSNTVTYCRLSGAHTGAVADASGILVLAGGLVTGNDNNTISQNHFTHARGNRPVTAFTSRGQAGKENNGNKIRENQFYDFLNLADGFTATGINLVAGSTDFTVSANSFSENTLLEPQGDGSAVFIDLGCGESHVADSNTIKGLIKLNTGTNTFTGIRVNTGTGGTTLIRRTIISRIWWANAGASDFTGIYISGGNVNVGSTMSNWIGDQGIDTLVFENGGPGGCFRGIVSTGSAGVREIRSAMVQYITTMNSGDYGTHFIGISSEQSARTSIIDCDFRAHLASVAINSPQYGRAISVTSSDSTLVYRNFIRFIRNDHSSPLAAENGTTAGIYCSGGVQTITGNTIFNIEDHSNHSACAAAGIYADGTVSGVFDINRNKLYGISGMAEALDGTAAGIWIRAGNEESRVYLNRIEQMYVNPTANNSRIAGISLKEGKVTCYNNIIGINMAGAGWTYGLLDEGGVNNVFYNTVLISDTAAKGSGKSIGMASLEGNERIYMNNLLASVRTNNSGTGKGYAVMIRDTANLTIDYNNYYVSGSDVTLGMFDGSEQSNLAQWQGVTFEDLHSLSLDPKFKLAGLVANPTPYRPGVPLPGISLPGFTTDFLGEMRLPVPMTGALEFDPITVTATEGVAEASYGNLTEACDSINAGRHRGTLGIKINNHVTQDYFAKLNASGTGACSYNSVVMYPTISGVIIDCLEYDAPLLILDGADSVTIDGRVNRSGSTPDLIIQNGHDNSSDANTGTLVMTNGACNNIIRYCIMKGDFFTSTTGIIRIGNSTAATGNSHNLICDNLFTGRTQGVDGRPSCAIYMEGSEGKENTGNRISNNRFSDLLSTLPDASVININKANSGVSVDGNSFYETVPFDAVFWGYLYFIYQYYQELLIAMYESSPVYYISVTDTTSNDIAITGNFIGGTEPRCGGSPLTKAFTDTSSFYRSLIIPNIGFGGIRAICGMAEASRIDGNLIRNIAWNSYRNGLVRGIHVGGGLVNVGTVSPNIIGSETDTNSILVNFGSRNGEFDGIMISGHGNVQVEDNVISSVTISSPEDSVSSRFYGILAEESPQCTITGNRVGSAVADLSIRLTSPATAGDQVATGILSSGSSATISRNTIRNISNASTRTGGSGSTGGIRSSSAVNDIITSNTIHDLTGGNTPALGDLPAVYGILSEAATGSSQARIEGNTVYNLTHSHPVSQGTIAGLAIRTHGSSVFSGNLISRLNAGSAQTVINGICAAGGNATWDNNIITLSDNTSRTIRGISEQGGVNAFYFNTVYIGGEPVAGNQLSFAFHSATDTSRTVKNNIFSNFRSNNGATGSHYAIGVSSKEGLTIDRNDYFAPGSGGILGRFGSADKGTLKEWLHATGGDQHSVNWNPYFLNAGGNEPGGYKPRQEAIAADPVAGILTAYDSVVRHLTYPAMGAFEDTVFVAGIPSSENPDSDAPTANQEVCFGDLPGEISATEPLFGGVRPFTYQWQYLEASDTAGDFTNISGATGMSYQPPDTLTGINYYRQAQYSASGYGIVFTDTVTVTINDPFIIGTMNPIQSVCHNTQPQILTCIEPTGGRRPYTYQWQVSDDSVTFADITGATAFTYQPDTVTQTEWYRVIQTSAGPCGSDTTAAEKLFVHDQFVAGSVSAGQTICFHTSPAPLTSAAPTGGVTPYNWQWQEALTTGGSAGVFSDIPGATNQGYSPPVLAESRYFRQQQTAASGCGSVFTDTVVVTVYPQLLPGTISSDQTVCYNEAATGLTGTKPTGGGDTSYTYQWEGSADNLSFTIISGATDLSYNPGALTQTKHYRLKQFSVQECGPVITDTVTITVLPRDNGGSVTGGTTVCYGTNSTLLTLTGHTGTIVKWQNSTNGTSWSDIPGTTTATYTAVNLTVDTWYRVVLQNGICSSIVSDSAKLTISAGNSLSGNVRYQNNPLTPVNGLKIILKQGSTAIDSVYTDATGHYLFNGLSYGTYGLTVKSAHPSGQWQTWGGVTNADYLLVSQHVAGSSLLQVDPPVIRVSASVKVPHPLINSLDAITIRQAAKYPLTGWSYFDIPKWNFSGISNAARLDSIVVTCGNVIRDIRALCAGDVNGTYVPGNGYKVAGTGLELANQGMIPVTDEMTFAVRLVETNPVETHGSASQKTQETHCRASLQSGTQTIGAITLFMNYDPKQIEILNITMQDNAGIDPWFETNNGVLYIGWISTEPISVIKNQPVLLVHTRLVAKSAPIRFTLNETLVSELADGDGNVIEGVRLAMPVAGIDETHGVETHDVETHDVETHCRASLQATSQTQSEIIVYPNPVRESLNVEYTTGNTQPSTCNLQLLTLSGKVVLNLQPATLTAGWNKTTLDLSGLAPGIYLLKVKMNGELFHKKVVVTR